jgi:membrane-associated phospholipid phosphatase
MLVRKIKIHGTILSAFLIFNFSSINLFSQNITSDYKTEKIPLHLQTDLIPASQNDLSIFLDDGLTLVKAPFNFSSTDWLKTGAFVIATGLAFSLDPKIKSSVNNNQSPTMDNITGFGEKYGSISYAGVFAGGMYLTGKILGDQEISTTGRMLVESVLYSGLAVSVIKYTVGRARPYANEGSTDFFDHTFTEENVSFPSGHTAIAFSVSTILARRINNTYATIALYGLAGFTGYQRIYDNKHWFSDVFVGAAIGYFIGSSIADSEENRSNENNFLSNLNIMPSVSSSGLGLSLHLDF